jgi:nicotinate-nucleotide pyrophosphorylase (carboxylating)
MNILKKYEKDIDRIIEYALKEDIGTGDITTELLIPENKTIRGNFIAKGKGIVCGLPIAKKVFEKLDKNITMSVKKKDGSLVKYGDIIAVVKGKARAILTGERLALNIMQRLSGIATYASEFVEIAKPYGVTILDTRKTTPMLRVLEKYAVKTGGAANHRMGLYDAVLIKDNHLKIVDIETAYTNMRRWVPKNMTIEIEVDTLDLLRTVIKLKPDIIMLDNMDIDMINKAVAMVKAAKISSKIEVSGGINMANIREVVATRVDYVSIGSMTHSPPSMDISLKTIF